MKAILSDDGLVLELSLSPETQFHPTIAAAFAPVPATTKVGQVKQGNKFVTPDEPVATAIPATESED